MTAPRRSQRAVTLIEYAAPMCPICANFNAREFPQLKEQYIDTGKVFYVFRIYPSAARIIPSKASPLPAKEQYFPFIDMMYRSQETWDPDGHAIPMSAPRSWRGPGSLACHRPGGALHGRQADAGPHHPEPAGRRDPLRLTGTPTFVVAARSSSPANIPGTSQGDAGRPSRKNSLSLGFWPSIEGFPPVCQKQAVQLARALSRNQILLASSSPPCWRWAQCGTSGGIHDGRQALDSSVRSSASWWAPAGAGQRAAVRLAHDEPGARPAPTGRRR